MNRKNILYVVYMKKQYGEHGYVLGVYTTKTKATKALVEEELYRGGKYVATILEYIPDSGFRNGYE